MWNLPAGGLDLARILITQHGMEERVIMLAEHHDRRDHRAALKAGVAHLFVKPIDKQLLLREIKALAS